MAGYSNHMLLSGPPHTVELFRNDEFWYAFNSVVNTLVGAYVPASTVKTIVLDPGLQGETLAFCSVTNTGLLRVNWIQ
jgi:hypothetical protein